MKSLQKITNFAFSLAMMTTVVATRAMAGGQTPVEDNLGLGGAFGDAGIKALNFESIVTVAFQILLAAAVLWVVYNIVMAGIKIAGAKEDADKRKEGLKSIVNAAIGLVIALSAYAIVNVVQNQFLGGASGAKLGTPCLQESGDAGFWNGTACTPDGN